MRYKISDEDFVKIWKVAIYFRDVMEATGMPRSAIVCRYNKLVKNKVILPKLKRPPRGKPVDSIKLNKIIRGEPN